MTAAPEHTPGDRAGLDQLNQAFHELAEGLGLAVIGWPRLGEDPTLAAVAIRAGVALRAGYLPVVLPVALPSGIAVCMAVVGRREAPPGGGGSAS